MAKGVTEVLEQHDAHVLKWGWEQVNDAAAAQKNNFARTRAAHDGNRLIEHRLVQDPSMSDAEYWHQRQARSGPLVGKVTAAMNMVEYIGGLARLKGASEMQIMAAAKYRTAYERAQIGGARAVDYAAVKVDTSGPSGDPLAGRVVDALDHYKQAVRCLGMMRSNLVERVICHDQSLTHRGMGARARARVKDELFAALDDLATHFHLTTRKAA